MKLNLNRVAETLFYSALATLQLGATSWAAPPPPPNLQALPATPAGNVEVSAVTVLAVAAYGYWRSRK